MPTPTPWNDVALVNTQTAGGQYQQQTAALADGRFVAVWTSTGEYAPNGVNWLIKGQIFNADGTKAGGEFTANTVGITGLQRYPTVATRTDGGFSVAWQTAQDGDKADIISGRSFNAAGTAIGNEFEVGLATTLPNKPHGSAETTMTMLEGGRMVVAWQVLQGTQETSFVQGIRAQILNADGTKSGPVIEYLTGGMNATKPALEALPGGGFMLAWTKSGSGLDGDIRGQVFAANGGKKGSEFTINGATEGHQIAPVLETLTDGRILAIWYDHAKKSIEGQFVAARGARDGKQFTLQKDDDGFGRGIDVTALADGGFVVGWGENKTHGNVVAQRFDATGAKVGDAFQVNAPTVGWQDSPKLATLADGRVVFTFTDSGKNYGDTSSDAVAMRIFETRGGGWTFDGTDGNDQRVGTEFADFMSGGPGNDILWGGGGDDILDGNDGNDILRGGNGNDTLHGGAGNDTASYAGSSAKVYVNLAEGYGRSGDAQGDRLVSIENLVGSDWNDVLVGDAGANRLSGGKGDDTLEGGDGNDTLDGGKGADLMTGGAGDDIYFVDHAGDQIVETAGEGIDHVYASLDFSLAGLHVENLTLTGKANLNATGNAFDNVITGNQGDNVIDGKAGADTMIGGKGDDTYYVDHAGDVVIEKRDQGTDHVISTVSFAIGSQHIEKLTLAGKAKIDGTGNHLDNEIVGNGYANVLNGMKGTDRLTGGAGKDQFVFNTSLAPNNVDTVTDFAVGEDKLVLDKAIFTGLSAGKLAATLFKDLGAGVADADDRILYDSSTGALYFDRDGSGGTYQPVLFAILENEASISAADFFIV